MATELIMPRVTDTMDAGTITRWLKHEGDEIKRRDTLAEIETDKANMELEAFSAGVLAQILVQEGQSARVGQVIAVIAADHEEAQRLRSGEHARGNYDELAAGMVQARPTFERPFQARTTSASASAPVAPQAEGVTPIRIFVSYRRDDSAGHAGRLYDRLRAHFGRDRVFMDVDSLRAGDDFVEAIENAVGNCDVALVVIGPRWLTAKDSRGRRRLDNPLDFVRVEVESALKRRIRVVPVLVHRAEMPSSEELPESLIALTRRHAHELSDLRFDYDASSLIASLDESTQAP